MSVSSGWRDGMSGFDLWPEELPGLGRRWVGPLAWCSRCTKAAHAEAATTFVRYGSSAFCVTCARAEAAKGDASA